MGLLNEITPFVPPISEQSLPGWSIYRGGDQRTAILRAQHRLELPWILEKIRRHIGYHAEILDVGCGYGFLANDLALRGHAVTGVDISEDCLNIAKVWDKTNSVRYQLGNACELPFQSCSFDVVMAMGVIEHVTDVIKLIEEAQRVLRPGGILIFNTLNRTSIPRVRPLRAYRQSPPVLQRKIRRAGMEILEIEGLRPVFFQAGILKYFISGTVSENFRYCFTPSPWMAYLGLAKKHRLAPI